MSVACTVVRLRLPTMDGGIIDGRLGDHVATCLVCQAEQARYRAMRRWLGDLRERVETAADLSVSVASRSNPLTIVPHGTMGSTVARTTVAAAAGAAVVAAAVIVGLRRSRAA
jgi:hypothetical protein